MKWEVWRRRSSSPHTDISCDRLSADSIRRFLTGTFFLTKYWGSMHFLSRDALAVALQSVKYAARPKFADKSFFLIFFSSDMFAQRFPLSAPPKPTRWVISMFFRAVREPLRLIADRVLYSCWRLLPGVVMVEISRTRFLRLENQVTRCALAWCRHTVRPVAGYSFWREECNDCGLGHRKNFFSTGRANSGNNISLHRLEAKRKHFSTENIIRKYRI